MLSTIADQNKLGMKILDSSLCITEHCMSQASKINIAEKQEQ